MRRRLAVLGAVVLAWGALPGFAAAEPAEPLDPPVPIVTLDALPLGIGLDALGPEARARASGVLAESIFAQRVTGLRFRSREAVFRFLLDHPDFAAGVARALRAGEYRLLDVGDGYLGDDARGATGKIRVLHAEDGRRLYHLEGRYARRGLPAIDGQLLVLFEFHHHVDEEGREVAEAALTGHLMLDSPVVGTLAQLLGRLARPLVERAVERKVRRFFATVARVSRFAADEPEQLVALLEGHPEVPQGAPLAAFRAILLGDRPPAWARGGGAEPWLQARPLNLAAPAPPGADATPEDGAPRGGDDS